MKSSIGKLTFAVLLSTGFLAASTGAILASAYQDAFASRIANPRDEGSLSSFVSIAVDAGQYDQALSTIEQHLISFPRDAKSRLIAGRLYNHVGSYDLALRQIKYALSIGTLNINEIQEAEKLRERIEKNLSGISGYISFTIGGDVIHTNFATTAAISDRTDYNPYGEIYGVFRRSLDTPTDDALSISLRARASRLFGDFDLSGGGGVFTSPSGRLSLTWDKGLPNTGISSLRLSLSAYGDYYGYQSNAAIREYGILAKFTVQPSADSTVFANFGYADLSTSDLLFTDYRLRAQAGAAYRISAEHAVGAAIRSQFDYTYGGLEVGKSVDGEISYAGLLVSQPDGITWTHRASFGGGHLQLPDLNATAGTTFDGNFWLARWDHAFELNERNRVDLTTFYRKLKLDDASRDRSSYGIGLSYTHTFR